MKIDCGPTWEEKLNCLQEWHKWFAWRPVRVGSHDCRWLEYIERKGELISGWGDHFWNWEYRALKKESE